MPSYLVETVAAVSFDSIQGPDRPAPLDDEAPAATPREPTDTEKGEK